MTSIFVNQAGDGGGGTQLQFYEAGDAFWKDLRYVPLLLSGIFSFSQLAHAVCSRFKYGRRPNEAAASTGERRGFLARWRWHIHLHGGYVIYAYMVARLVGSVALLYIFFTTAIGDCEKAAGNNGWTFFPLCVQTALTIAHAYTTLLAVTTFSLNFRPLAPARFHVTILCSILAIYAYRDIWPLANYGSVPKDQAEGNILWVKIALLVITGVIIPLFIPHPYVPVDPKNPSPVPNPEQTASWISALTYTYADPIIILANKVAHLRHDQLPPLSDYDFAQYLSESAAKYVDPFAGAKRRHLFFGLLSFFRREYIIISLSIVFHGLMSFVAPIGINKTLNYLETRQFGTDSSVKPWVWVLFMFVGPVAQSGFEHWNLYIQTQARVRLQAVLTQLFFEHSLRIRMKAETSNDGVESTPTPSEAGDNRSVVGSESIASVEETGPNQSREDAESQITQASTAVGTTEASASTVQDNTPESSGQAKPQADEGPPVKKSSGDAENLIGKINNLVTSDLENMVEGCDFPSFIILVPLQITFAIIFLYNILGWSAIAGLFTTIALSPIAGYFGKIVQDVQVTKMKLTDARVQTISEAVGVLRMIKLFGWEGKMTNRLDAKREEELSWLWKLKKLRLVNELSSMLAPMLSMMVTYASYTVVMKEGLTASKIFSSMAVFSILQEQLHRISWQYSLLIEAKVSLDRANSFLQNSELLDRYAKQHDPSSSFLLPEEEADDERATDIGFKNATFSWSDEENDGSLTPSSRKYRLHIEGELLFKRNCINLIIGPTGSGKTSMLMALLGEMHFLPSQAGSWYKLPRAGGIAYAAQESWVQNATIRENIVFGSPFDEERYAQVIKQCALEHDLTLFDAGDNTEVGERGLTLSGGQKARVTLARAIYSSAEIILLDDVLAALDVHTSAWIIDKCFRGDLVKGRTIMLVTHNVALAGPVAEYIITMGLDGSIVTRHNEVTPLTKVEEVLAENIDDAAENSQEEHADKAAPTAAKDGKLVMAEEIVQGHITWKSIKLLLSGLAGNRPIVFCLLWIGGLIASESISMFSPWFLGLWGSQYERHAPSDVNLLYYLSIFATILLLRLTIYAAVNFYYQWRSVKASKVIHAKIVDSVFSSTLRWLDETPTARIIARCTQDIRTVDGPISQSLMWVVQQFIGMFISLGSIVLFTPVFLLPGVVVAISGIVVGNLYLKAQLSLKREMSNARSPLLAHFSAAIHGLVSIRAYGAQRAFAHESYKRINHYSRTARTSWTINRWVGFRIDTLGALFTSALALYLVYASSTNAANTGFSLNMAVRFCLYIFWLIRIFNELEVESNSLERIQGYIDIEHEPKPTPSGLPPAAWPTSGDVRVENLSARYSQTGPKVLHNLSFHISSGQRIGVVGRTGSGKSSLTLALLRCILTEGTVFYDGIATNILNLDALRSNITIIPQTPELLSGTLRQNLDPFDQNDDATLNDALRASGLFSLQEEAGEASLTLDSKIAGGGNNLSVGQRQIIALARAMVRGSKLLILDEATSAIDYKTDAVIQSTLRSKLGADVTVITVAHRLQTIMDADKIMVLDNGKIAEFDSPRILLERPQGILRALVDGSGDQAILHELAGYKERET